MCSVPLGDCVWNHGNVVRLSIFVLVTSPSDQGTLYWRQVIPIPSVILTISHSHWLAQYPYIICNQAMLRVGIIRWCQVHSSQRFVSHLLATTKVITCATTTKISYLYILEELDLWCSLWSPLCLRSFPVDNRTFKFNATIISLHLRHLRNTINYPIRLAFYFTFSAGRPFRVPDLIHPSVDPLLLSRIPMIQALVLVNPLVNPPANW